MKKLMIGVFVLSMLTGCGAAPSATVSSVSPSAAMQAEGLFSFDPSGYKLMKSVAEAHKAQRDPANVGKRFAVAGKLYVSEATYISERMSISDGSGEEIDLAEKGRILGNPDRFFAKFGAGTKETVTAYYEIKDAYHVKLKAVKRANGKFVKS